MPCVTQSCCKHTAQSQQQYYERVIMIAVTGFWLDLRVLGHVGQMLRHVSL